MSYRKDVQGPDAYQGDGPGQDKSGSPVELQVIDMNWVQPCRSVEARAALGFSHNAISDIFGTVAAMCAMMCGA
jgi:hypothetical protein